MINVRVVCQDQDRYVGALAKALAVEVGGFNTVKGATHDSMFKNGFYLLSFANRGQVDEFKTLVETYLSSYSVGIEEA